MDKYIKLLENNDFIAFSNISFINELVEYKYKDKYLIEYLLEQGIHSDKMDNYLMQHIDFLDYYLKYNIIKPILSCSLKVLLEKRNDKLILDIILDKISDQEKIILYNNIRKISFNDFYYYEKEIRYIFLKHGIVLPKLFISDETKDLNLLNESDQVLIEEFVNLFKDCDIKILDFVTNELKRNLNENHERAIIDIKKLIEFKKNHKDFKFIDSKNKSLESYDPKSLEFISNTRESLMYNHEFSHFLYSSFENQDDVLAEYEEIRCRIDNEENYQKIKKYLKEFHTEYEKSKDRFKTLYIKKVLKMYKSFDNYVEHVYRELKTDMPLLIEIFNSEKKTVNYPFVMEFNFKDVVLEYLENEKNEFIYFNQKKYFSEYRMLENLLDSIFKGKFFDDIDFKCISGHGSIYFDSLKTRSFDECLANYDAIKKSNNKEIIIVLKELIGDELILFLDNYIKKNREGSYEYR